MTNDLNDIKNIKATQRTHIQMANGECVKVEKVGSTEVTWNLKIAFSFQVYHINYSLLVNLQKN